MLRYLIIALVVLVSLLVFRHFYMEKHKTAAQQDGLACPELSGRVVSKGQPDYEKARLGSNYDVSKEQFPRHIVYCKNNEDVQHAVLWSRCNNVEIRIRSGAHQYEAFSSGNDVILIDVSEMKDFRLDKANQMATIQPGLSDFELYGLLFKEGLTHVGGAFSKEGISDLILNGGMGPLLRREGLSCDSLISVDMVGANGHIDHATKDNEHKDLFWAACGGGGGNFGIVVSMSIKVYPASDVTWFSIGWDKEQSVEQVLSAWQDFFSKSDKRWFSHLDLWAKPFPSAQLKKQPIKALGMFWGTPDEARAELAPLLNTGKPVEKTIALVDWAQAIKLIDDSSAIFLGDKPEYKSSGAFVMDNLPQEALKIIDTTLRDSSAALLNMVLFSMSGASSEILPTATAYYYRNAKFFINYSVQWLKPEEAHQQEAELKTLRQRLVPFTVGDYIGNPDPDLLDYLSDYYGTNVNRLECIKRKYDPQNIFHFEQSIPPALASVDCSAWH